MNLLILEPGEAGQPLPRADRRYQHVTRILRKKAGDSLSAGLSDGSIGVARIDMLDAESMSLSFEKTGEAPPLHPVRVLMGFPRPIQSGRILKDLTSLGVERVWFALSDLGEKSYAESDFFRKGEFALPLSEGAEQAGNPRLPEVRMFWSLDRAIDAADGERAAAGEGAAPGGSASRVFFHPGAGAARFGDMGPFAAPLWLAIGSERGWTPRETALLEARGFARASLGSRILKSETAAAAAVTLALNALRLL